ncbi:MAG: putative bifunctional diguanylate cyclase/phosphodiesterase [Actinomycetota bacterium]
MSLVPIVLLGLILGAFIRTRVAEQALDHARRSGVIVTRLGIQPLLSPRDVSHGLTRKNLATFDRALKAGRFGEDVLRLKIWNRDGDVVYSDDRDLVGRSQEPSHEFEDALEGEVASEIEEAEHGHGENARDDHLQSEGRVLEVYVPMRFESSSRVEGVFEIYLPYEPTAARIERDTRNLYLVLLGGLVLLWLALFRIVARASRTMRRQAEELREHSEKNEYQALHDELTGLPNRNLFRDRIEQALLAARRGGHEAAVMLMDLDRFKEVNNTLGHRHGDGVLQQVGPRLRAALRESDTVAHLGGDEFAILLPKLADPASAMYVAEKIRSALHEPFLVQGLALDIDASTGIALFPEHGEDADTLIQRADVAMYLAKAARSGCEVYTAEQDHHSAARLSLLGELRRAIDWGELVLHYQPKARLQTGEITGVEALVRWQHPVRGFVPPDEFVPLAEHTGLIKQLTARVLDEGLRQCREWLDQGLEIDIAVNLSMRNLLDAQLPDEVARLLERWDVPPQRLTLEITESTIMADPARALTIVSRLSDIGVGLAIDDFGTGYSSLAHLKRLPVEEIKIDKSFVMNMHANEDDAVIVRSTIDLAHNLGRTVVAEGVENEDIMQVLRTLGCDTAQGYHLSRPVPPDTLSEWLASQCRDHGAHREGASAP